MIETPESNVLDAKVETPEQKAKWTDDIFINIPLTEFLKMKKKISKLERKVEIEHDKYWDEWRKNDKLENAYFKLKADYQKVLGITEEGDDKK